MATLNSLLLSARKKEKERESQKVSVDQILNGASARAVDENYAKSFYKDVSTFSNNLSSYSDSNMDRQKYILDPAQNLSQRSSVMRTFYNSNKDRMDANQYKQAISGLDALDKTIAAVQADKKAEDDEKRRQISTAFGSVSGMSDEQLDFYRKKKEKNAADRQIEYLQANSGSGNFDMPVQAQKAPTVKSFLKDDEEYNGILQEQDFRKKNGMSTVDYRKLADEMSKLSAKERTAEYDKINNLLTSSAGRIDKETEKKLQTRINILEESKDPIFKAYSQEKDYERRASRIAVIDRALIPLRAELEGAGIADGQRVAQLQQEINVLENEKAQLQAANNTYDNFEGRATNQAVLKAMQDPDFEKKAAKRNYSTASYDDYLRNRAELNTYEQQRKNAWDSGVYDEAYWESIKPESLQVYDPLGLYKQAEKEKGGVAGVLNEHSGLGNEGNAYDLALERGNAGSWNQLKPEEEKVYYALLADDKAAADAYLDSLTITLNKREEDAMQERLSKLSAGERVLYNVATIPANFMTGVPALLSDVIRLAQGKNINPYDSTHKVQNWVQGVRDNTAKAILDAAEKNDLSEIGQVGSFLYQTGMSIADSALGAATMGDASAVLMGMNAAVAEGKRLFELGATKEQIALGGLLSGAAEAVFEYISLDKLLSTKGAKTKGELVRQIFSQAGVEASEEVFTEISNKLTNQMVMGRNSDFYRRVREKMDEGLSESEAMGAAFGDAAMDVLMAGVGGAISGGVMAGVKGSFEYKKYQSVIKSNAAKIQEDYKGNEKIQEAANKAIKHPDADTWEGLQKAIASQIEIKIGAQSYTVTLPDQVVDAAFNTNVAAEEKLYYGGITAASKSQSVDTLDGKADMDLSDVDGKVARSALELAKQLPESGARAYLEGMSREIKTVADFAGYTATFLQAYNYGLNRSVYSTDEVSSFINAAETADQNYFKKANAFAAIAAADQDQRGYFKATDTAETAQSGTGTTKSGVVSPESKASLNGGIFEATINPDAETEETDMSGPMLKSDGSKVSILDIQYSDKADTPTQIRVRDTEDNVRTVSVDDITYENENQATVLKDVIKEKLPTNVAKQTVAVLGDTFTLEQFEEALHAFNLGRTGNTREIRTLRSLSHLTQEQKQKLFDLGRNYQNRSTRVKDNRVKYKEKAGKGGTIERRYDTHKKLNPLQKAQRIMGEFLAKSWGLDVVIYDSSVDTKHKNASGFYREGGRIFIDINAGNRFEGTILNTFAHELTHFIQEWNPGKYRTLANFLVENYNEDGVSMDAAVEAQQGKAADNGRELSYTDAFDEVVAESMAKMLDDPDAVNKINQLRKRDSGLVAKLKERVEWLWGKLKNYFAQNDLNKESIYVQTSDKLEQFKNLFAEAAAGALDNYARAEVGESSATKAKNMTRYMLDEYSEHELENWSSSKNILIYESPSQYDAFIESALQGNAGSKKMYFGKITSGMASDIFAKTGKNVEGYNCSLSGYEIQKINKDHGDEAKEAPRGQRAVGKADYHMLPIVIGNYDSVKLSDNLYDGKPALEFTKKIDGSRFTVIAVISDKRLDLRMQTAYIGIKKGNLATPLSATNQGFLPTSGTPRGTVSSNNISQQNTKGNTQNAIDKIGGVDADILSKAKGMDGKTLFQIRAMEHDAPIYRAMLQKHGKMSGAEIDNLFNTIDAAMSIIEKNLEALDYAWEKDIDDRAFSPIKPNADPLYKVSLDFSTLCRKRITQQVVQRVLQEALGRSITREESAAIRSALQELQREGLQLEVACACCYVESARMKSFDQIQKFLDNRAKVIADFFAGSDKGATRERVAAAERQAKIDLGLSPDTKISQIGAADGMSKKQRQDYVRDAKKAAKAEYKLTAEEQDLINRALEMSIDDFTTPEGLENLAKNYPRLFDAYTSFIRNATKSKGVENDVWWRAGDLKNSPRITDGLLLTMNSENGMRSQSWSDFQVIHLMDYIASTIELSTKDVKTQSYTKVPDYVKLMGNTNAMINLSLIPTAAYNGALEFDNIEGMPLDTALRLRDKYHATTGTISIGMSIDHIKALLASDLIDYVIPYHASSLSKDMQKRLGIPKWDSFQPFQNAKEIKDRKKAAANAKRYGARLLPEGDKLYHKEPAFSEWFNISEARSTAERIGTEGAHGIMSGAYAAMQEQAEKYIRMCAERGMEPKFSYGDGNFINEENYWKLLIDRKMVDNITGEVIEQKALTPKFDMDSIMEILNDELERYGNIKKDEDEAIRRVTEQFLSGNISGKMSEVMKKPVDNVTVASILQSNEEETARHQDRDTEYMAAVESDDTETQRSLVEEAADEALNDSIVRDENGKLKRVYHGTPSRFNEFSYEFMSRHGSAEGQGFYFTDNKNMASGYKGKDGRVLEGYLDMKKVLSDDRKTMSKAELRRMLQKLDPTGDDIIINYDTKGGLGYPGTAWKERALTDAVNMIYNNGQTDSEMLAEIANAGAGVESTVRTAREMGYDGYINSGKYDGATVYVAFESNQFKSADLVTYDDSGNVIPLSERFNPQKEDIRYQDRDTEYMAAVESGDIEMARQMVLEAAKEAGFENAIPEQTLTYKVRTKAAPRKTIKVYKTFTVAPDGSPTALFVSSAEKLPMNVWMDAQDTWHFTADNGNEYVPSTQNPYTEGGKTGASVTIPSEEIRQELIARGFLPEGSKAQKVTALAYRPGWHAGDLPFFPQGGKRGNSRYTNTGNVNKNFDPSQPETNYENIHRYNQVVFECEMAADTDYTAEAQGQAKALTKSGTVNQRKADLQYMPADGFYYYTTNPTLSGKGKWAISGSLKIVRALSQAECDSILESEGFKPQEWEGGQMDLASLGYTEAQYDAARKTLAPITYDDSGNVIPLSERFNSEKEDIRYQSRDPFITSQLEAENAKLRSQVEKLTELVKLQRQLTNGTKLTDDSIRRVTNSLAKDFNIPTSEKTTLQRMVSEYYHRLAGAKGGDISAEEISTGARNIAEWMQAHEEEKPAIMEYAKTVLSEIRNSSVRLDDLQKQEAQNSYDSYGKYRQAMFGKINISDNASMSLDSQWQEWAGRYPDIFGRDVNPADMPIKLAEIIQDLRSMDVVESQVNEAAWLNEAAEAVYNGYWDTSTLYTPADKYHSKITDLKIKHRAEIEQLKQSKKDALQNQRAQAKERFDKMYRQLMDDKQRQLRELREKRDQKIKDIKQRNAEARHEAVQKRRDTVVRNKIRTLADDINRRLTHPTEGKYIPADLTRAVVDVLETIDFDTGRSRTLADKLAKLQAAYDQIRNDDTYSGAYGEEVSEMIKNLSGKIADTPLQQMTTEQLEATYNTLKAVDTMAKDAVKVKINDEILNAIEMGSGAVSEMEAVKGNKSIRFLSNFLNMHLRPKTMFERLGGFKKDSNWSSAYILLNAGQLKKTRILMEGSLMFSDLLSNKNSKNLNRLSNLNERVDLGLTDRNGNKVEITRGMMLSLYMHLLNEDNARHVMMGGMTLPNLKEYYKGDISKAWGKGHANIKGISQELSEIAGQIREAEKAGDMETVEELRGKVDEIFNNGRAMVEGLRADIANRLSDYEKDWIKTAQKFFDEYSRNTLNEATMELYGFKKANVDNYFPIHSDSSFMTAQFEQIARDISLENMGFMKERIKGTNPILLEDLTSVIASQVKQVAEYAGMTKAMRDFNKFYNYKGSGYGDSLKNTLKSVFGEEGARYIDNLMSDLVGGRNRSDSFDKLMGALRGNYAQAVLTINPSVAFAQAASFPTAGAIIPAKYLTKALFAGGKNNWVFSRADQELISKYCPEFWYRMQGYSTTELGEAKTSGQLNQKLLKKTRALTGWITAFDAATVGRLWYATQYYVDDHLEGLEKGSEAYYKKIGNMLRDVIQETQPNYTTMQRPDALRSQSPLWRQLVMFKTQPLQNFNIVYDAGARMVKYAQDYKAGLNDVTRADVVKARKDFARAVSSQVAQTVLFRAMKTLTQFALFGVAGYRDDDDELTAESVTNKILYDLGDTVASNMLFGSELYGAIWSLVNWSKTGKLKFDIDLELSAISGVTNTIDNISKFANVMWDDEKSTEDKLNAADKLAGSIGQVFGIPYSNVSKIVKAGIYWAEDIRNGNAGKFEATANRTTTQLAHLLYRAILNNDTDQVRKLSAQFKDEKTMQTNLKKYLRTVDERVGEAAQARLEGKMSKAADIIDQIAGEGHFTRKLIDDAVKAEMSARSKTEDDDTLPLVSEKYDEWGNAGSADRSDVDWVYDLYDRTKDTDVLPKFAGTTFSLNGATVEMTQTQYDTYAVTRGRAARAIVSALPGVALFEAQNDTVKASIVNAAYGWANQAGKAAVSDFVPDKSYQLACEAEKQGISMAMFLTVYKLLGTVTAEKNAAGNAVSGSAKAKKQQLISGLPLTGAQKTWLLRKLL